MINANSKCNVPKYGRAYRAMTSAIQHQTKLLEVRNSESGKAEYLAISRVFNLGTAKRWLLGIVADFRIDTK